MNLSVLGGTKQFWKTNCWKCLLRFVNAKFLCHNDHVSYILGYCCSLPIVRTRNAYEFKIDL